MGRRIESLLPWLRELTFPHFISLPGAANIDIYVGSWAGIAALQRHFAQSTMNAQAAPAICHDTHSNPARTAWHTHPPGQR